MQQVEQVQTGKVVLADRTTSHTIKGGEQASVVGGVDVCEDTARRSRRESDKSRQIQFLLAADLKSCHQRMGLCELHQTGFQALYLLIHS